MAGSSCDICGDPATRPLVDGYGKWRGDLCDDPDCATALSREPGPRWLNTPPPPTNP